MSDVKWTDKQIQAIYSKGQNVLVAAAAGSGKTAVLVERIINKIINENVDIDRLLVATFTNAAASEMKERVLKAIYKKLEEEPDNENLQKQILLLNKASICTIHSFCLDVIRNNFYELENISPNFRIAEETEIQILKQEILEDMFEKKYNEENEDFLKLINTYTSYKDDTPLKDMVLAICNTISSMTFPKKWLREHIEMFNLKDKLDEDFSNTTWGKLLLEEVQEILVENIKTMKNAIAQIDTIEEFEPLVDFFQQDVDVFELLLGNLDNWDKAYSIFTQNDLEDWPKTFKSKNPIKDDVKKIRDNCKTNYRKIAQYLSNNSKDSNENIYGMYDVLVKLENFINEFSEEFTKRKQEKNIVDFSDIEHYALKILIKVDEDGNIQKTEVAKKYSEKFEEVAIDEYQDSNDVQEQIMKAVSRENNLFMVGDVKQSIYKFRQAMPEIFLEKYDKYTLVEPILNENKELLNPILEDDTKILLFNNFRSRENILYFTNLVFQNIMSLKVGNVDYTEKEYLFVGAKDYEKIDQNLKTEFLILNLKDQIEEEKEERGYKEKLDEENEEERYEDIELEAKMVAKKIIELKKNKFQVFDRKEKKFRDIDYKDFVILFRSPKNKANIFEQELINAGVPVYSDMSQEYLDSIEITTIMSLLKIIDNPMQDIPLVTVLRSSIGKFTDEELVKIRLCDKHEIFYTCMQKAILSVDEELKNKILIFLNDLDKWRKEQEYLALDELIWKIYSDTGYYNYVGLMPNGALRQANLKLLFEKARQYESSSFKGLYNFINFINRLQIGSGDLKSAKLIGENENVVRIMSIHKSKGLEFPVVFVCNVDKQFNLMSINTDKILIQNEYGLGMRFIDHEKQLQYETYSRTALRRILTLESISEEMRVLYVALTRAKEKLFITGVCKDYEKELGNLINQSNIYEKNGDKINNIFVKKCHTYLKWLLLPLCYDEEKFNSLADITIVSPKDVITKIEKSEEIDVIKMLEDYKENDDQMKKIKEEIEFEYKHKISCITPTKTSVSEIKRKYQELENAENEETEENLIKENTINLAKPKFLKKDEQIKLTSAQKGTLMHLCFQKLNEKENYNVEAVSNMIENMYKTGIISKKEKDAININKIMAFINSKIWKELQNAKKVYKEKPFFIEINASELNSENTEDKVLVQGIIDLYYINENDELILLDYKTDFVKTGEEDVLIQKYKKQLELYKTALEKALNRKVDKVYIYSVALEKEIKI